MKVYPQNFEFFVTRTQKRTTCHFDSNQKVIFLSQIDRKIFDYLNLDSAQLLACTAGADSKNNILDHFDGGAYAICVYLRGVPTFSAVFPQIKRNYDDDESNQAVSRLSKTILSGGRLSDDLDTLLEAFSNQGAIYFLFDFSCIANSDDRDLLLRSAFECPIRSFVFLPDNHFRSLHVDTVKQEKSNFHFTSFSLSAFSCFILESLLFSSAYFFKIIYLGLPFAFLFLLLFGFFAFISFSPDSFFLGKNILLKILFSGRKRIGGALLGFLFFSGMVIAFFEFGVVFQDNHAFSISFLACVLFIPLFLFLLGCSERNNVRKRAS
jgi:hypothetical protein